MSGDRAHRGRSCSGQHDAGASEFPPAAGHVTELLAAVGRGDPDARGRLWGLVYDELHLMAQRQLTRKSPASVHPTTLVHETYLRLFGNGRVQLANHRHFFAAAAQAMRRIRVDDARKRGRLKRGGPAGGARAGHGEAGNGSSQGNVAVDGAVPGVFEPQSEVRPDEDGRPRGPGFGRAAREPTAVGPDPDELLALDESLRRLEQTDARKAAVVNLRFFGGLSVEETAAVLGVSTRTVESEWRFVRAWLRRELESAENR